LSLSFRLFGNILADELTLSVLYSLVPVGIPIPVFLLGLFTSGIQALVFPTLAAAYLGESMEVLGTSPTNDCPRIEIASTITKASKGVHQLELELAQCEMPKENARVIPYREAKHARLTGSRIQVMTQPSSSTIRGHLPLST